MELDKRITKIAIIYDCFDCKDARASIGEKGYFLIIIIAFRI